MPQPKTLDPAALERRAIATCRREGWTTAEILAVLKISRRTLRRREAEIRAVRKRHEPCTEALTVGSAA